MKDEIKNWGMSTKCVHAGEEFNPTNSHAMPIFMTSSFKFKGGPKEAMAKFDPEHPDTDNIYGRFGNPNFRNFESKVSALYRAEACLAFPSGMSVIKNVFGTFLEPGDHVLCGRTLYGCTHQLVTEPDYFRKFGVEFSFVDPRRACYVVNALKTNTRIIYLESLSNPTLELTDLENICKKAKMIMPSAKDFLVVVDNTFLGPYHINPLRLGADLVLDSDTKYIAGHGDLLGGSVAGKTDLIERIAKQRAHGGAIPGAFESWLAARGLKTYALRMKAHNENASLLAKALEGHPLIKRVIYPGLKSYMQHGLAKKLLMSGYGGMIAFELAGGKKKAEKKAWKFLKAAKGEEILTLAVSLGSVDGLIECPDFMTHASVPEKDKKERGIIPELLRYSVGIEDYEDIWSAFMRVLSKI